MAATSNRLHSELPSGDPALLNRIAWSRRWSERQASVDYALAARRKALDGVGRRSRAEQGFALRTLGWQAGAVAKARDTGMLEEPSDDRLDADILAPALDTGAQAADATDHQ